MKHKPIKSALCTAITFGVFVSLQLSAAECLDSNTFVCITETNTAEMVTINTIPVYISQYSVTNMSDQRIYGFAVTNTVGINAGGLNDRHAEGWEARTLSFDAWNSPSTSFSFTNDDISWISGETGYYGSTPLGTFNTLFVGDTDEAASESQNVNFYWNSGAGNSALTTANPLNSGVKLDQFYFYGTPESNFAAFDINGAIIASSITTANIIPSPLPDNTSPVPEPSTYLLLLAGLGIITIRTKKTAAI